MTDTIVFGAQRDVMLSAYHEVACMAPTVLVRGPHQLTKELLESVGPRWVILPDWSWIVPGELLAQAAFVGFHTAPLPDYRGGSPLQHQIIDGVRETRLSMFRMTKKLDAGNLLIEQPMNLEGTISEVWARIVSLVPGMVARLLAAEFEERPQPPGGFTRRRRDPSDSRLEDFERPLSALYDFVRALDDPYPNAFLVSGGKRLAFRKPRFDGRELVCEVVITEEP